MDEKTKQNIVLLMGAVVTILIGSVLLSKANALSTGQGYETITPQAVQNMPDYVSDDAVKIIEYSDFQCPYCARAVPIIDQIKDKYGSKVDIQFKHYPLDFHQNAAKAAEAAECARDQDKFWEYHDILFANQASLSVGNLKQYARQAGLDTKTFNGCLDSGEKKPIVDADTREGASLGVRGTPTFYINGQQIVGAQPFEVFSQIIDTMIEVNQDNEDESADPVVQKTGIKEVKARAPADPKPGSGSGSCGGACGSPSCGAASGGSCGCGG
ncbi:DsbA family protein [Candidatus Altiarchaeota archaeon]